MILNTIKNIKFPNSEADLHPHARSPPPPCFIMNMEEFLFHINSWDKILLFIIYAPIETQNIDFSAIRINLLSIFNFLKLNPKDLVGLMNHGGGSVPAWGCKSASELDNLVFFYGIVKHELYLNTLKRNFKLSAQSLDIGDDLIS
ncbi:hypothetical protein TNCV_605581 [Trichonephila clavipes]|nr:hypothetical protein TNCV_605581 [Trichonephila clavipes]